MMTFDEYRDRALLGVAGLFVTGLIYLTMTVLQSVSKGEVEEMVKRATESSPYTIEKHAISKSIEDLYTLHNNQTSLIDKNKEQIQLQNERIWESIQKLNLELEKLNIRQQIHSEESAKKKEAEEDQEGQ